MSAGEKKVSELPLTTTIGAGDYLLVTRDPLGVPTSNNITYGNLFANVTVSATFSNNVAFRGSVALGNTSIANLVLLDTHTPSTSTDPVVKGQMWFDANYLYIATADSVIKRVTLSSF